jgi:hypothetical protein
MYPKMNFSNQELTPNIVTLDSMTNLDISVRSRYTPKIRYTRVEIQDYISQGQGRENEILSD